MRETEYGWGLCIFFFLLFFIWEQCGQLLSLHLVQHFIYGYGRISIEWHRVQIGYRSEWERGGSSMHNVKLTILLLPCIIWRAYPTVVLLLLLLACCCCCWLRIQVSYQKCQKGLWLAWLETGAASRASVGDFLYLCKPQNCIVVKQESKPWASACFCIRPGFWKAYSSSSRSSSWHRMWLAGTQRGFKAKIFSLNA